jgi:hypothetical protein
MEKHMVNAIIEARLQRAAERRLVREATAGTAHPAIELARRVGGTVARSSRDRIGRTSRPAGSAPKPGRLGPACS